MSQQKEIEALIHRYKREEGVTDLIVEEFTAWMVALGWPLPAPISPMQRLQQKVRSVLREETRIDEVTHLPYRVNHAYPIGLNKQGTFFWGWVDIDEAPRHKMWKALQNRREQMVGDGLQLTLDAEHWSRKHPDEAQIVLEMDFGPDIEWRKSARDAEAS